MIYKGLYKSDRVDKRNMIRYSGKKWGVKMKKKPLYQVILNDIKKDILDGLYRVNDQIPTELELSEKYDVSRITSKRALAELENEGYIYRLRGKGSFVKEVVKQNGSPKKQDILFIMPFPKDIGFGNYTQGIFQGIEETSYRLVVQSHENINSETLPQIIEHYAGVIFYPINKGSDLELLYSLYLNHVPTVILDKEYEGIDFTTIVSDNKQGGYEATKYLLDSGLEKIGFVSSQPIMDISTVRERYLGYLKALHDAGNTDKTLYQGQVGQTTEQFIEDITASVKKKEIEGLVAENDIIAISLINSLKQAGISIPEEVSIVGFDNIQASELIEPKLTTVAQNFNQMGYLACQKLIEQIEKPYPQSDTIVVDVDFIERDTTKKGKND